MTGEDGGGRRWLDRVYPDRKSLKREEGGRGGTDLALDLMIFALLYLQRSKQWVVVTGSWKVRGRSQDKYLSTFPLSDQIGRFGRHPPDRSVSFPSFPPLPPIAI